MAAELPLYSLRQPTHEVSELYCARGTHCGRQGRKLLLRRARWQRTPHFSQRFAVLVRGEVPVFRSTPPTLGRDIVAADSARQSVRKSHTQIPSIELIRHFRASRHLEIPELAENLLVVLVNVGLAATASLRNDVMRSRCSFPLLRALGRLGRGCHFVLHDRLFRTLQMSNSLLHRPRNEPNSPALVRVLLLVSLAQPSAHHGLRIDAVHVVPRIASFTHDFCQFFQNINAQGQALQMEREIFATSHYVHVHQHGEDLFTVRQTQLFLQHLHISRTSTACMPACLATTLLYIFPRHRKAE